MASHPNSPEISDASYIYQRYSRLVIDCNRQLRKPQSVLTQSDGTLVPGNADLSEEQIAAREDEIMRPYHARIESELQARLAAGRPTALFAMHSCTDRLLSDPRPRPWEISVIAGQDWRIADALLDVLRTDTKLCIGVNEPYTVDTDADYTVPVHAERQGIAYVEIEIRQDLIKDPAGQREWATLLSDVFPKAVAQSGILSK